MNGNPIVLVTGGSRGIGAATCLLAAERGYRVAINFREDETAAQAVAKQIRTQGGDAETFQADIGEPEQIIALFEAVDAHFGAIDGLVNNAGIVDRKSELIDMSVERMERMFRINVIGSLVCAREAVRRMSTRHGGKGGVIVNVSSLAATLGSPGEYVDYAASKGAIDTFTTGLAKEVADQGIRVCGVRPGTIATEIHASGGQPDRAARMRSLIPMGREGRAEEIAETILFLLSDKASYVTGAMLDADGGR